MAVVRELTLTLLSNSIHFNMQKISVTIPSIYVLKHAQRFFYVLIDYYSTFRNIWIHAKCSTIIVMTLQQISFQIFLGALRGM